MFSNYYSSFGSLHQSKEIFKRITSATFSFRQKIASALFIRCSVESLPPRIASGIQATRHLNDVAKYVSALGQRNFWCPLGLKKINKK